MPSHCMLLLGAASFNIFSLPALAQAVSRPSQEKPPSEKPSSQEKPPVGSAPRPGQSVTVPLPGAPGKPVTAPAEPVPINPYKRDIDLTVPLTYRDRSLGDLSVRLTADNRYMIASRPFLDLIAPMLNAKAGATLRQSLGDAAMFSSDKLGGTGISVTYDPGALAVIVAGIAPDKRATEFLFAAPNRTEEKPDIVPAGFSAFLNLNIAATKFWGGQSGFRTPGVYMDGAIRVGGIVMEGDGQFAEGYALNGQEYRFDRNYLRLVYDQPSAYRRFFAGDLQSETRGSQSYVRMGGIGVLRQRRRFDLSRSAILQGNRQIVLQRSSTIDVYRNGALLRQFRLDPGSYDLSTLPLISGSNDLNIQIRDDAGRTQSIAYSSYLDPIDLEPGDFEYGAYIGKATTLYSGSPVYNGKIAFSGFFRKAFVDKPAIGIGLQASAAVQNVIGQTQFILGDGSRLQFDVGGSNTRRYGPGVSTAITYSLLFDRGDKVDSLSLRTDYVSRRYGGLGNDIPDNRSVVTLSANYTRSFTQQLAMLLGINYIKGRGSSGNNFRIDTSSSYRFAKNWSVRGGINYTRYSGAFTGQNGIGFNVALVFQPSYRDRSEARYDSNNQNANMSYVHSSSGLIDSVGYGGVVGRDLGSANVQAFADYIGNRFSASVSHSTFGSGFSDLTDRQATTLNIGTSLAFADGHFGVGRRITDSFAVLYPHETLKGHSVVAGQSLAKNAYMSKSGTFGGAVNGFLSSYTPQSIQYDVEDVPRGYDIGSGVVRVKPPYKSGYALRVGGEAFVSATGTLSLGNGTPVSLAGGRVIALDGKDSTPIAFFTNSVGRFAIENLRPNVAYRVELFEGNRSFEFRIPKNADGLIDLKLIKLNP